MRDPDVCLQIRTINLQMRAPGRGTEGDSILSDSDFVCLQIMTLESEMRALEEDLEGMAGLLRQSIFTDPDSPPAEAVSELDSIQDRLAELKVRQLHPCCSCAMCVMSGMVVTAEVCNRKAQAALHIWIVVCGHRSQLEALTHTIPE